VPCPVILSLKYDNAYCSGAPREYGVTVATGSTNYLLTIVHYTLIFAGEIFDYLLANGRMKEKEARSKFRQVS
jgi:hypothetical protein